MADDAAREVADAAMNASEEARDTVEDTAAPAAAGGGRALDGAGEAPGAAAAPQLQPQPAPAAGSKGVCDSSWLPTTDGVKRGLTDFKNVFLFPLCTGLMTGVGFVAGKRLAERYFYGPTTTVAVQ